MALNKGRGLTQAADNCFVHTYGAQPRYLVGVIHRQDTGNRGEPPACHCGFLTGGTPFAKGHIMALELGGCDESFNIVPQYELWQGAAGGAWRDMETAIKADLAAEVMVVEIDYAAVADAYDVQKAAFTAGDSLQHWTGPNIPIRFRVWTVTQATVAEYLAASDADKELNIAALIANRHAEVALLDESIDAMPDIDRRTWKFRMVRTATRLEYNAYSATAQAARDAALLALVSTPAANVGGAPGPMRRSRRGAEARHNANPMLVPVPPEPLTYALWANSAQGRNATVARIQANTANASLNWTVAERLAFTAPDVDIANFAH
ncbi:hypothetical protein [Pseudomonas sp. NPDC089734]|uniref:hypothetical protein n=1 Tax=Pseudomonas sp. NPDC089734 TaxID=3364469 RepID=UPI0038092B73